MLLFSVWLPLVLQLAAPLILLAWLAWPAHASRATWMCSVLLVAAYIVSIAAGGLWLVLPWYLPYGCAVLGAGAVVRSWRRVAARPILPTSRRARITGIATAFSTAFVFTIGGAILAARTPAAAPVDLVSPLRGDRYVVVNGGGSTLINAHIGTLSAPSFAAYRGQSYGIDIIELGPFGLRASGVVPADPAAYAIFGDPVYAPCAGEVIATFNEAPDMRPPTPDRRHMAGNHVILACAGAWVVLAHLKQGSVSVRAGEHVAAGLPIGFAGNSGNSDEPHLHLHAQRPGTTAAPLGGAPLPVRIDGRDPVRNSRLTQAAR
jgi:hypothetical protein